MTRSVLGDAAVRVYGVYGVYAPEKIRSDRPPERPGQIQINQSRMWGFGSGFAQDVHPVHPVHPDDADRPKSQLTANGGAADKHSANAKTPQRQRQNELIPKRLKGGN